MPEQKPYDAETIFPFSLIEEVVEELRARNVRFATYKELALPRVPGALKRWAYVWEFLRFKGGPTKNPFSFAFASAAALARLKGPGRLRSALPAPAAFQPVVLLQHDADRQPYKTLDVMHLEQRLGVRSSSFFFLERHMWDGDNEPYDLDVPALQALESSGFEVGYHLNAYELAEYDLERAWPLIERDIRWFAERFDLRSFVPHGGKPGAGGLNNDFVPFRPPLSDLRWCYNGRGRYGFAKDTTWSDGGVYVAAPEDPREVARRITPGQRMLFLMHPQYYGRTLMDGWESLPVARERWWRDLWQV